MEAGNPLSDGRKSAAQVSWEAGLSSLDRIIAVCPAYARKELLQSRVHTAKRRSLEDKGKRCDGNNASDVSAGSARVNAEPAAFLGAHAAITATTPMRFHKPLLTFSTQKAPDYEHQ